MISFDKAGLPAKVYLSGADCFHLVLDKHAAKHGAGGNVMRKVFYFSKSLQASQITEILNSSPIIYWLCNITLVTGNLFRAPYWKYTDTGNEIILREHNSNSDTGIPEIILERDITVNAKHFIEADLVHFSSGGCAFILSWNHILLDAKGTTLLFDHLNHLADNKQSDPGLFFPARGKKAGLIAHIRNMYRVKKFIQTSSRAPVSSVADEKPRTASGKTGYRLIHFNADETKLIHEYAFKAGSRFGPTLYFIACCSQAIHLVNKKRNHSGDLWLPVPYDGRLKGAAGPIISNCVSFLFYRIPESVLSSIREIVRSLNSEMTNQIKNRVPTQYNMFLDMMKHIPLWLYYFLISRTGKGTLASFLYTSTGDNFNELKLLFGQPVNDITMIPALTFPPGLTFVFLKHDDKLNLNIVYAKDTIDENELHLIEQSIKNILLAGHS